MKLQENSLDARLIRIAERLPHLRMEDLKYLFDGLANRRSSHSFVSKDVQENLEKAFHDRPEFFLTEIDEGPLANIRRHHQATYQHCLRVGVGAYKFGLFLGLKHEACASLMIGGILHDIGKTRVPLEILDSELEIKDQAVIKRIQDHAGASQLMLSRYSGTAIGDIARDVALYHHERMDGRGYPEGLKGEQIPFAARLVSICDTFDAMTDPTRKYQKALTAEQALLRMICNETASLSAAPVRDAYDPTLLASFIAMKMQEPGTTLAPDTRNTLSNFVKDVLYPGTRSDPEVSERPAQPRLVSQAPRA